ncbi:MAG: endopeptidase La [Bacteroidia bacterium]|jgi:ATP-dependent Lon protease|nr:endopeptidase La [Bacteroidia bacterium]
MSFFEQFNNMPFEPIIDEDSDFIPLLSTEDEDNMHAEKVPNLLSILPLRNTVLFPGVVIPITVGRDKSINLIKDAFKGDKIIGVVAQKNDTIEDPSQEDLNSVGTVAQILKMLRMPDGNTTVIIQGKKRFRIKEFTQSEPYYKAKTEGFEETRPEKNDEEFEAIVSSLKDTALQIIQKSSQIPTEAGFALNNIESQNFMVNFISSNMNATATEKQNMLEVPNLKERATLVLTHLVKELQKLELKNQIQNKVKVDLDKEQRDYFLHQQIKTIQKELGEKSHEQDIEELKARAVNKKWSKEIAEIFEKQIGKLARMNPNSGEFGVQTNYVELLLDLPFGEYTTDNFDLNHAESVLNEDHFGLEKVKERIIEHLAVLKLKGNLKSPIICLYGPPGVGKTSLGKSVAKALNRKYVRMSLGGLKDESEIRGHRKTYIGAMPGRILQNLKKVQSSNPVFILDEIDKIGSDYHGDPSSALLEVLDPEQNTTFYDNFLETEYDLSKVLFIATCNNLSTIQPALRDRMEIIEVSGYTVEEKIEIAKQHLLPKQVEENGLKKAQLKLSDKQLEYIIENYTAESGVRGLEKKISKVARYLAVHVAKNESLPKITETFITKILGPSHEKSKYQGNDVIGVVTGLAWTQVGGDILYIETSLSKGKGSKLTLTGNLGDVMKESATIALEFIKSHHEELKIDSELFENHNIHIHVPEGATPKDGPSAGIAMLTALTSALTKRKVKKQLAMTGEITLRGKVLPVGGIKEKILAAKRAGIKEIMLCADNEKDILDIKPEYVKGLTFNYVTSMIEVLHNALLK